jgi:hypothetical protein
MEKALEAEGMTLKHVIGPGTAHKYHPDSKIEINRIVDALAERGRDPLEYNIYPVVRTRRLPIWVRFETGRHDQRPESHGVRSGYQQILVGFVSQNRR